MIRFAVVLAALTCAAGTAAVAAEMPMPQVFRGTPFQKGQWKMEMLEMSAAGATRGGHSMTICMDDIREMGRNQGGPGGKSRPDCKIQLLKDTATEAVMETTCPDSATRATITRESDRSYLMQAAGTSRGESYSMKARYTFESAQCTQSGAGMGGVGGMSMDKNSPECQKARAQLSSMNPGAMCANAGANRAMCEQNIQRMRSQLEAMCR
jgi:opacity protein-like surface antigen